MRPNKYGAKKTQIDGIWFDSKAEGMHYLVLRDRERKGEINLLHSQREFPLVVNGFRVGSYTVDFCYTENGVAVADEVKGFKARDWSIRSKLFMALHPAIELRVNGVAAKRPKAPKVEATEDGWIVRRNLATPPRKTKGRKEWSA